MTNSIRTRFLGVVVIAFLLSTYPHPVLCDNATIDGSNTTAKVKSLKKTKKSAKKAKGQKLKVAKTTSGPQDEISDQTEVSQQANSSSSKKKGR